MSTEKLHPDDDRSIKKRIYFFDLPVCIEILKDQKKVSKKLDGSIWIRQMYCEYGYFDGIISDDGEELDCYVGEDYQNPANKVYLIEQRTPYADGLKFDETKVILGMPDIDRAMIIYWRHCQAPECLGNITSLTIDEFKDYIKTK